MKTINWWFTVSTVFILLILIPNLDIIRYTINPGSETWVHIKTYLLRDYIINTIIICFFTGIISTLIGAALAFFITVYDFPFRKFFSWAMVLPLSIPPYIGAYTYAGILSFSGVIQTFLRNNTKVTINQKWFDIMSLPGTIFIFTIFLFPYVYMLVRSSLQKESNTLIESARTFNKSMPAIFLQIILPISRIAIVSSVSLVILEVLSDYGVVSYFGIQTLSTAIFTSWFDFSDIPSALKISGYLLLLIFGTMCFERLLRGRRRYSSTNTKVTPVSRKTATGLHKLVLTGFCMLVFALGFVLPVLQLGHWAMLSYGVVLKPEFLTLVYNTVTIALLSSGIIMVISLIIANYVRIQGGFAGNLYSKITIIGYSIPGTIIAITVILFFQKLDNSLAWFYKLVLNDTRTLILSLSLAMLVFAYVIRFLAVGFQPIEGGFEKISKKFYEASKTLGKSTTKTFFIVDIPMLKPAIISGLALVFVDIVKELPLALLLRPFNFNTLATQVFVYANDELIIRASIPSLIIIATALIGILTIYKAADKEN